MKKMNKKGFTLIELLAVIVILAVIMVIAVPQILEVISSTKKSAWESNGKLIDEAIQLQLTIGSTTGESGFDLKGICTSSTGSDITSNIAKIADISDVKVTCKNSGAVDPTYTVTISPTENGQFKDQTPMEFQYN